MLLCGRIPVRLLQLFAVVGATCLLALKAYLLRARRLQLRQTTIDPFQYQDIQSSPNLYLTTSTTNKPISLILLISPEGYQGINQVKFSLIKTI